MQNIEYKVEKNELVIRVKLDQRHGLSGSGNTIIVGGTQGNVKIGHGDIAMGLTVYTKEGLDKAQLEAAKAKGHKTWAEYQQALKAAK